MKCVYGIFTISFALKLRNSILKRSTTNLTQSDHYESALIAR